MRFFSTYLCMVQTAFVFIFMSTSLLAQNSQDKVAKARDAIEKAQQFLTNKRYDQAIKEFQTAHRLQPDLQNLIMIANLYGKLNVCIDSIQTWQDALGFCQNCENRTIIMQKQQKTLEKCYVSVSFSSNPIGIEVFQNQNRLGITPLIKPFTLGEYTLEFKKEGFEDHRETIFVGENDLRQKGKLVHIELMPISHMLQPQNIKSNPEPEVGEKKPSSKKKIVAYSLLATSLVLLAFDLYYYVDQKEVLGYLKDSERGIDRKAELQKGFSNPAIDKMIQSRDKSAQNAKDTHYTVLGAGLVLLTSSVFTFVF